MSRLESNPDLERLGDALRASATIDLAREDLHALDAAPERRPASAIRRPRILAGSTLGLAGVAAGLVLALGGSSASPAYAVTQHTDGSLLVHFNFYGPHTLGEVDQTLIAKYHETILVKEATGPATVTGPVTCTPTAVSAAPGDPTPTGPTIRVELGTDGTARGPFISGDNTGAVGIVHLASCAAFVSSPHNGSTGSGVTGNTGS